MTAYQKGPPTGRDPGGADRDRDGCVATGALPHFGPYSRNTRTKPSMEPSRGRLGPEHICWEYGPEPFWWLRAGRYGQYQLDSPDWPCQGGDPTACEPPDLTVHILRTVTRVFGGHLLLE